MTALVIVTAVLLDLILGEPKRFHPLVGFGSIATKVEKIFNSTRHYQHSINSVLGAFAWMCVVLPCVYVAGFVSTGEGIFKWIVDALILYMCVGHKSLREHVVNVLHALEENDLDESRKRVGFIVSRDTTNMNRSEVSKATIESTLENGLDAVFSPIFWFIIFGAEGAVIYRLANTLDAMWGYKTDRYRYFGKFAARADDLLNWVSARLVAASYMLVGDAKSAFRCWKSQAHLCESPNAGPVMCSGAGALGVVLGGSASYHGKIKDKPIMGVGREPDTEDIERAMKLVSDALLLWCGVILLLSWKYYV